MDVVRAMLRAIILITPLILTLEASWFLLQSNLGLSAPVIAELSSTKYGYNRAVVKSLSKQNADSWIGFGLLLFAFLLQMIHVFWPMQIRDSGPIDKRGAAIAVIVCVIIFSTCFYGSRILTKRIGESALKILEAKRNR